jgi:hypothetical protein
MYIKEIKLTNIRSVRDLHIVFKKPSGWHVILGANGTGKTSILRAVCAGLIGPTEVLRLDPDFGSWVTSGEKKAEISLRLIRSEFDAITGKGKTTKDDRDFDCNTTIENNESNGQGWTFKPVQSKGIDLERYNWSKGKGWFSAAFGPYRRFTGGTAEISNHFIRNPKIGAHLTAFKEEAALTETIAWLKQVLLNTLSTKSKHDALILEGVKHFINQGELLPDGYHLDAITKDGPIFSTPTSQQVHLYELSEGIKSVTCLAIELIRLLVEAYDPELVLKNFLDQNTKNNYIECEGVVLIDEIDVHLHPNWQARIGQWFTRVFPKIQFIVTTHSPLVCRAAVKGQIWYLPASNSGLKPYEMKKKDMDVLIFGDILDAYSTDLFGTNIARGQEGQDELKLLAELNQKFLQQKISDKEKKEREILLKKHPFPLP